MTVHAPEPLESACVHADAVGYGTRGSLAAAHPAEEGVAALWTDGHPCMNPARDLAGLAAQVLGRR